jgi:hypothetical protein
MINILLISLIIIAGKIVMDLKNKNLIRVQVDNSPIRKI